MQQDQGKPQYVPSETSQSTYERLLALLLRHAKEEEPALREYQRLAQDDPDPVVRLLMGMLVADERSHHSLFDRMIRTLGGVSLTHEGQEMLPGDAVAGRTPGLVDRLRQLADAERQGADALQGAAAEHPTFYGGVFRQLLEWMAADSQQHAGVIEFLADRLEEERRPSVMLASVHRRIDQALRDLCASEAAFPVMKERMADVTSDLKRHLYVDEEFLFPLLEPGPMASRVAAAIAAHGELCEAMRKLEASRTEANLKEEASRLLGMLHDHEFQEEFVLYQALDELVDRPDFPDLERLAREALPANWRCRAERQ